MFRWFSQLGRSRELRLLDDELRAAGLHPQAVPDAVKLTMLRLQKAEGGIDAATCRQQSLLLAWCTLGRAQFSDIHGPDATAAQDRRLQAAIDSGDSPDARLVLLALHAGLVDADLVESYGLEAR